MTMAMAEAVLASANPENDLLDPTLVHDHVRSPKKETATRVIVIPETDIAAAAAAGAVVTKNTKRKAVAVAIAGAVEAEVAAAAAAKVPADPDRERGAVAKKRAKNIAQEIGRRGDIITNGAVRTAKSTKSIPDADIGPGIVTMTATNVVIMMIPRLTLPLRSRTTNARSSKKARLLKKPAPPRGVPEAPPSLENTESLTPPTFIPTPKLNPPSSAGSRKSRAYPPSMDRSMS
mmetsp:Transcript_12497/g.26616  ORF Transcript_12497/g.26616 Transcript_12497/m.26616 type:complete len:233 (-) Transcript_12497:647-1345(-)